MIDSIIDLTCFLFVTSLLVLGAWALQSKLEQRAKKGYEDEQEKNH